MWTIGACACACDDDDDGGDGLDRPRPKELATMLNALVPRADAAGWCVCVCVCFVRWVVGMVTIRRKEGREKRVQ